MEIKVTDMFGIPLAIGDRIAYPVRQSSSMWMSVATIVKLARSNSYRARDRDDVFYAIVEGDSERSEAIWNTPDGKYHDKDSEIVGRKEWKVKYRKRFNSFGRCIKLDGPKLDYVKQLQDSESDLITDKHRYRLALDTISKDFSDTEPGILARMTLDADEDYLPRRNDEC